MADEQKKGSFWSAAAPVIGSVLDFGTGLFGSLFNRNEAEKNRQFQREMYEQQFNDNLRLWHMTNNFNLPSAQVQRLRDANLNPLLMYSNGASGVTAASPSGASAPSGSQASSAMQSNFNQAAMQSALIRAQIANINADTEQKQASAESSRSTSANLQYDLLFKKLTQNVEIALKHGNLENLNAATNNLVINTLATSENMFQNILTLRQAREYEVKRFNLDFSTIGVQLDQDWKRIANDTERVKQGWRGLALQWLKLQNDIRWTNEQIGALRWNVLQDKAMFGLRFESLSLDNKLKIWDTHLKKADFSHKQTLIFNQNLKNFYLRTAGSESVPYSTTMPSHDTWQFGTKMPTLQDMLVIPSVKPKNK